MGQTAREMIRKMVCHDCPEKTQVINLEGVMGKLAHVIDQAKGLRIGRGFIVGYYVKGDAAGVFIRWTAGEKGSGIKPRTVSMIGLGAIEIASDGESATG